MATIPLHLEWALPILDANFKKKFLGGHFSSLRLRLSKMFIPYALDSTKSTHCIMKLNYGPAPLRCWSPKGGQIP